MSETKATRTVTVENEEGIHVRAADLIAKQVRQFDAKVVLAKGSHRVEGTEVLQILSLGALPGDQVVLEADGADAEQVLDAMARLFADGFGPNE
ncbi:MAG: HPr family phosphocarrier protein [Candidatus Nealsonbacteria bacterium]|nr:HPr family phosphocarrier protein [Candidatus Nealsonbacteria bacterium]